MQKDQSKLKITDIIIEAVKLYKSNLRLFLTISSMIVLLNLLNRTLNEFQHLFNSSSILFVYKFVLLILFFPITYYSIKLSIASIVCTALRCGNKQINISGALNIASGRFWGYVGANIRLFLIIIIPVTGGIVSYFHVNEVLTKCVLVATFATLGIYLTTIYGFAPLMASIEDEKKQYFMLSRKLVKGNLRKVFILVLIIITFLIPGYVYFLMYHSHKEIYLINKYIRL